MTATRATPSGSATGVFGANPDAGMVFAVTYRFGARRRPATSRPDAISQLDPSDRAEQVLRGDQSAARRPAAPTRRPCSRCSASRRRSSAPTAAARGAAADYAAAAQTLPWVKRAGARCSAGPEAG